MIAKARIESIQFPFVCCVGAQFEDISGRGWGHEENAEEGDGQLEEVFHTRIFVEGTGQ